MEWAWLPHDREVWVPVEVVSTKDDHVVVRRRDVVDDQKDGEGKVSTVALAELQSLQRAAPTCLDGVADMISLEDLGEPVILHTLRVRYARDQIYTRISSILVSVNPYRRLDLYTRELMEAYRTREESAPHLYALAHECYARFQRTGNNQSVVISGESGSGKTEATKIVLRYLSFLSEPPGHDGVGVGGGGVEERIVEANPVIEAFGNAKTVRNSNSSRFGKWMEIHYDSQHRITGGSLKHYLLEKSRVVTQGPGERNYHIFYQLLAGGGGGGGSGSNSGHVRDAATAGVGPLGPPDSFEYLRGGGQHVIAGVSDRDSLGATLRAMRVVGFAEDEIAFSLDVVAAVLHLGNVSIGTGPANDQATLPTPADADQALAECVRLLGVPCDKFARALCGQSRKFGGGDMIFVPFTRDQARANRDAFSKQLYGRLFDWIIRTINGSLETSAYVFGRVGVLDIFGFEIFEHNSLEQFLINFANEKLQQHFNHFVFEMEQEEYRREEVDLKYVTFQDNSVCIALIEQGLMGDLDEEVALPKGSDDNFLARAHAKHASHTHYEKPRFAHAVFTVRHYAGGVTYEVAGFLDKNRDRLQSGLVDVLALSGRPLVAGLFSDREPEIAVAVGVGGVGGGGGGGVAGSGRAASSDRTLGQRFKGQLASLMSALGGTDPHFVRCIKPNTLQAASNFDSHEVLRQLRYAGIEAVIRIRKQGFPVRMPHRDLVVRYRPVVLHDAAVARRGQRTAAAALLAAEMPGGRGEHDVEVEVEDGRTGVGAGGGVESSARFKRVPLSRSLVSITSAAAEEEARTLAESLLQKLSRPSSLDGEAARQRCDEMVAQLMIPPEAHKFGVTKVFLTQGEFDRLELRRSAALAAAAVQIQRASRGRAARRVARGLRRLRDGIMSMTDQAVALPLAAQLRPALVASFRDALRRASDGGLPPLLPAIQRCRGFLARVEELLAVRQELARASATYGRDKAAAPQGDDFGGGVSDDDGDGDYEKSEEAAAKEEGRSLAALEQLLSAARSRDEGLELLDEWRACDEARNRLVAAADRRRRRNEALVLAQAAAEAAEGPLAAEDLGEPRPDDLCALLRACIAQSDACVSEFGERVRLSPALARCARVVAESERHDGARRDAAERAARAERDAHLLMARQRQEQEQKDEEDQRHKRGAETESEAPVTAAAAAAAGTSAGRQPDPDGGDERGRRMLRKTTRPGSLHGRLAPPSTGRERTAQEEGGGGSLADVGAGEDAGGIGGDGGDPRSRTPPPGLRSLASEAAIAPELRTPHLSGAVTPESSEPYPWDRHNADSPAGAGGAVAERLKKATVRLKVQDMLIEKLQEKIGTLEEESTGIRSLYRELNQSLFEKLGEYGQYKSKVSLMEKDYVHRLDRVKKDLRAAESRAAAAESRAVALEAALSAHEERLAASAAASNRPPPVKAAALVRGLFGWTVPDKPAATTPKTAASAASAADGGGSELAAPDGGDLVRSRNAQLERENAALVRDFATKCEQFLRVQMELDDALAQVHEERTERQRVERTLRSLQDGTGGGGKMGDVRLRQAQDRIAALERENKRLVADVVRHQEDARRRQLECVQAATELKRLKKAHVTS